MGQLRRLVLTALPKLLISRATRVLVNLPLPRPLRGPIFRTYARCFGANLGEMRGGVADYRSVAEFFQRPLAEGARPIDAGAPLVWPADGAVVATGPFAGGRLPQIKGQDYALADLLDDPELAQRLDDGSQATVYLAPGDYHRIHAPFAGEILRVSRVPGGLFPVNGGAVRSIPGLFARNERMVLEMRLDDGRPAAIVLVAALNVSDTVLSCGVPGRVAPGDEVGRFGMGSTVVAVAGAGEPAFPVVAPETTVRVGRRVEP